MSDDKDMWKVSLPQNYPHPFSQLQLYSECYFFFFAAASAAAFFSSAAFCFARIIAALLFVT